MINTYILQREKNYMIIKNHIKFSYKKDLEKFIYYYNVWKYTTINSPNVKDIEKRELGIILNGD